MNECDHKLNGMYVKHKFRTVGHCYAKVHHTDGGERAYFSKDEGLGFWFISNLKVSDDLISHRINNTLVRVKRAIHAFVLVARNGTPYINNGYRHIAT